MTTALISIVLISLIVWQRRIITRQTRTIRRQRNAIKEVEDARAEKAVRKEIKIVEAI
ncbi:MAG: hypothetical protein WDA18_09235 [Candidatus Ratteibacteria bacterium]|jgi:hypothetical protein|nr:hypothetical protein [Candidatus Cloacimonadota bacterium]HOQ80334.1 hypothetical protein [Candidatus Cloacimonadota bacterium]HPK41379.1 hypothetical protein [Candidatus Cloacimonadota bacterium]